MPRLYGLELLLAACNEALTDARAGLIEIVGVVPELERLCGAIQAEIDLQATS